MLQVMKSGLLEQGGKKCWEGDDLEAVAAWREGQLWKVEIERKATVLMWAAVACGVSLLGGGVLIFQGGETFAGAAVAVVGVWVAGGLFVWANILAPTHKVVEVARAYWPLMVLPLEDKSAVYDLGGVYPKREIALQLLNQPDRLQALQQRLQQLMGELNVLEPESRKLAVDNVPLYGVDADLVRTLTDLNGVLGDTTTLRSRIPAIPADDAVLKALSVLKPCFRPADVSPVMSVPQKTPVVELNNGIVGVYQESGSEVHYDIDDILAELETYSEVLMDNLEKAHVESVAMLQESHRLATWTVSWPSMAFHCPLCSTTEELGADGGLPSSTRLFLDPETRLLQCPICSCTMFDRDAVTTSRFSQEVFKPAYFQVLLSLRNEILRIDRDIEKQLMELSDKRVVELKKLATGFKQERRKKIERLRALKSQTDSLKAQIVGMTTALANYKRIQKAKVAEYNRDCEEIAREVDQRAREAEARIRQEFQARAAQAENEAAYAYAVKKAEEDRKHQEMLTAIMMTEAEKEKLRQPKTFGEKVLECAGMPSKTQREKDKAYEDAGAAVSGMPSGTNR